MFTVLYTQKSVKIKLNSENINIHRISIFYSKLGKCVYTLLSSNVAMATN